MSALGGLTPQFLDLFIMMMFIMMLLMPLMLIPLMMFRVFGGLVS